MHRWFDVYAFRVGQPESRNVAILFNDITQRKRAEQALRESEARYRTLFENFPNGAVFLFDHALRYTLAGGTGLAATGLSRQMFEGKTLGEIFPPEIAARDEPVLRAALAGASTRVEVPFGTSTFVVDTLPVRDEQGTIVGGMVMTQDITERKHAEEERSRLLAATQAARAEAEAALQVRDAFLSIASHELRTPLTALQGYAGMLRNRIAGRQDGDAQTMRLADTLLRQVDRMNQLIGHLLDVSRLQHGQFAVDLVPMDLAALVTQIVDEFRLTLPAGAASPAIELTPPEDEVLVLGDPARLEEVVQNLLTNAVKYSPGGGIVRVRVTQQGADASVEVTDQGIGIPLEAQAHLFEPFYRAGNVDRRTSGFGIGLYVVREIVQGHGGRIVATSIEGQGSTFCVTLPVHDSSA